MRQRVEEYAHSFYYVHVDVYTGGPTPEIGFETHDIGSPLYSTLQRLPHERISFCGHGGEEPKIPWPFPKASVLLPIHHHVNTPQALLGTTEEKLQIPSS